MNLRLASRLLALAIAVMALAPSPANANFIYVESVNGDLSNGGLNPTLLVAGLGLNSITGTSVTPGPGATGRDLDYFTVAIPAGSLLDSFVLSNYSGANLTFFGMMAGTPFTVPPTDPPATIPPRLLGWVHMTPGLIGSNLFPTMSSQTVPSPVIGFTAPLPAGDYSFWIQEAGTDAANYSLNFNVSAVPELSTFALTNIALILVAAGRRLQAGKFASR
jgi:hypothetical protein